MGCSSCRNKKVNKNTVKTTSSTRGITTDPRTGKEYIVEPKDMKKITKVIRR